MKNTIKLNEAQLRAIVKEAVSNVLKENQTLKKSKNSIFNKNQRAILCTVFSAVYAIYQNGI